MKTTNYHDTFIEVAEDCPANIAEIPPDTAKQRTVARIQYELLHDAAYQYTSDDVLFNVYAIRNNIARRDAVPAREQFFSKAQACLRASPLAKRYGWGVHSDSKGRIAIYAVQSEEYAKLARDKSLKHLKALRTSRGHS